ncbi:MAG: hypothetical protein GC168_18670 [Candidatus Hydrogenedens sp.]|nr:hypothetical protein [Candidatus Hydrogenedens sp.]
MKIGVINRFYPPDPAPTGLAAAELVGFLCQRLPAASLTVYATKARYAPGCAEVTDGAARVVRLPSLYDGKASLPRLAASLFEGRALARRATKDCDLVIALTDPPLLPLWVGAAVRRYRRRWIEWTMDLYPAFLVAAGVVGASQPFYRHLDRQARRLRPNYMICLGVGQRHWLENHRGVEVPTTLLPSGICPVPPRRAEENPGRLTIVCAGNYGAAHPVRALVELIERADPARFYFVLALHGSRSADLRRRLDGHPAVEWRERLSPEDLAAAAAHFVCLAGAATHLCVPSKAVTAVCLGRPFLFAGSPEGDSWQRLGPAGWLIPERPDGSYRAADIDAALAGLADPEERAAKAAAARFLAARLNETQASAFETIAAWIEAGGPGGLQVPRP